MLTQLLQEYGFSAREAKIYLTSLEFGEDVVSSIARRAGENRVTTYSVLKDLTLKGIANEIIKNNKKYYSVVSPKKLVKIQEEKYKKLKNALPELIEITRESAHKPKVYFYDGFQGIKEIYEDSLTIKKGEILNISGTTNMAPSIRDYLTREYRKKRVEAEIELKTIYSKDNKKTIEKEIEKIQGKTNIKENQNSVTKNPEQFRQIKYIPSNLLEIKNTISLYDSSKVALIMFSNTEMSGIIVESKSLHHTFKTIFEFMWNIN